MFDTPILFLIFNRPDTTQKVFDTFRQLKPKYLYIAADGPRPNRPGEQDRCTQARAIIKQIDWDCQLKTLFRSHNLGCGKAVSQGITWFFDHVEQGIIIEDDIIASPTFFHFAEEMLSKYKDTPQIMHISAFNPLGEVSISETYYFSMFVHIWGWATWKRAWQKYIFQPTQEQINQIIQPYHTEGEKKYLQKLGAALQRADTWDYQWTMTVQREAGLGVSPNKNLILNIGFGEDATHTTKANPWANVQKYDLPTHIIYPATIARNKKIETQSLQNLRYTAFRTKIINKLNSFFP